VCVVEGRGPNHGAMHVASPSSAALVETNDVEAPLFSEGAGPVSPQGLRYGRGSSSDLLQHAVTVAQKKKRGHAADCRCHARKPIRGSRRLSAGALQRIKPSGRPDRQECATGTDSV